MPVTATPTTTGITTGLHLMSTYRERILRRKKCSAQFLQDTVQANRPERTSSAKANSDIGQGPWQIQAVQFQWCMHLQALGHVQKPLSQSYLLLLGCYLMLLRQSLLLLVVHLMLLSQFLLLVSVLFDAACIACREGASLSQVYTAYGSGHEVDVTCRYTWRMAPDLEESKWRKSFQW